MVNFSEFKKFFVFNLIGALVISALVAVVTVLIGDFNKVFGKIFLTLFVVGLHSLIALMFIWDNERQNTFERLAFFINTIFWLVIFSFIVSLFGIWDILEGRTIGNLYEFIFVLAFASLHADILTRASGLERYIDKIIYINFAFMTLVVLMLMPIIFIEYPKLVLGELFFRILGAAAIIDGTLSILTIIFYKLYFQKHPKAESPLISNGGENKKKGLSIWVWILIIFLASQIIIPLIVLLGFLVIQF